MGSVSLDIAQLLAGSLVLVSFMLLYQDRLSGLLNIYALHAFVLSLSVAWQAYVQQAPHLYVTAAIALVFKAMIIPFSLNAIVKRLRIHRTVEIVGGVGLTMPARARAGPPSAIHASKRGSRPISAWNCRARTLAPRLNAWCG